MALELKGLKGKAVKAGAVFDRLNRAYDKLIETGDAHAADVEGLAPQIDAMQDDITFAAQTLGNSVNGSGATETAQEPPKPPPVIQVPETLSALPAQTATFVQPLTHTFRAEAEQQIAGGLQWKAEQIAAGHKP